MLKNTASLGLLIILSLALLTIFSFFYIFEEELNKYFQNYTREEVEQAVTSKIEYCSKSKNSTICLREAAREFIQNYKVSDVLTAFDSNTNKPEFFSYCHTTLHFFGREIYHKNGDIQQSLNQCTSTCFQGCQHGVLEGYLADRNISYDDNLALRNEIVIICGKQETYTKRALYNECLHGLGHALMFVTDSDLPRSLKLCDALQNNEESSWCWSGAFMENSTSSTDRDHPSKYLKADDPLYPCNIMDRKYLNTCYKLQGFYFFTYLSSGDVQKTIALCEKVPLDYQDSCFDSIGQSLVGNTQDINEMNKACYTIKGEENINACITGVVGNLIERYSGDYIRAINFCNSLAPQHQSKCFSFLLNKTYQWGTTSDELRQLCSSIKEKQYASWCQS